jgi:raffinose/stachyose/melibiose transport system permease protein
MAAQNVELRNRSVERAQRRFHRADILNILMILLFVLFISPTIIIVNIALKTQQESIVTQFYVLPQKLQFVNFINIFRESQIIGSFFNSILISVSSVAFCTVVTSMAAYIIARNKSRFSKGIYYFFLVNFFVPGEAVIISVMQLMKFYHLYGYLPGLVILYTSGASAMAIYLFCAYIRSIPVELDEAAIMDGAGMMRFFWTILFPLMKPVVVTFSLIVGINIYNDFMTPLLFLKANSGRTVTLEILNFVSAFATNYPMAFSGIIVASVPILVAFFTDRKSVV